MSKKIAVFVPDAGAKAKCFKKASSKGSSAAQLSKANSQVCL